MARLPYPEPEQLSDETKRLLDQLPVKLNIFRMMANAPTCFRPLALLGTAILSQQKLSPKLREFAILRVANLSSARYEWIQHVPIAEVVGATKEQIAAIERGSLEADCFDDLERTVLRFTTELVEDVRVSDMTFAEASSRLSPQEVVELVLAVGYYMMIARLLETTDVDIEEAKGVNIFKALR
jgi:alkylhydroperoxidase family enzyme